MIGHAPREKGSCEEQVWPNIDQRCLVRAEATANSGNTSSPWQNDKLSPPSPTAITTMNHQSSLQGATNGGNYAAAPTPLEQDALNVTEPSDATVGPFDDNASELREPIEPPRKRARRHSKPFHLHFGGFRF